jgi:hypothetical protein
MQYNCTKYRKRCASSSEDQNPAQRASLRRSRTTRPDAQNMRGRATGRGTPAGGDEHMPADAIHQIAKEENANGRSQERVSQHETLWYDDSRALTCTLRATTASGRAAPRRRRAGAGAQGEYRQTSRCGQTRMRQDQGAMRRNTSAGGHLALLPLPLPSHEPPRFVPPENTQDASSWQRRRIT